MVAARYVIRCDTHMQEGSVPGAKTSHAPRANHFTPRQAYSHNSIKPETPGTWERREGHFSALVRPTGRNAPMSVERPSFHRARSISAMLLVKSGEKPQALPIKKPVPAESHTPHVRVAQAQRVKINALYCLRVEPGKPCCENAARLPARGKSLPPAIYVRPVRDVAGHY